MLKNCIGEIQRKTNASQWHYVVTDENLANIATRYIETQELQENNIWWYGPPPVLQKDVYFEIHSNGILDK